MKRKYISIIIILFLIVLGGIFAYFRYLNSQIFLKTNDAYVKGDVYSVSFKTSGKVKEVFIDSFKDVKQGDLIATLEEEDFEMNIKQSESKLKEAIAQVEINRAQIEERKANIKALESQLELAEIEKKRAEALLPKEAIPKQKYDQAVTSVKVLSAQVENGKMALKTAIESLKVAEEKVRTAEVALENAKLLRSYCNLYAPVSGKVTKKSIYVGEVVSAGQPVCAIVPLTTDSIWIEANYKETQLKRIKVGQKAKFFTDVNKKLIFEGEVDAISPGTGVVFSLFPPENATGNWVKIVQRVPVKIKIKPNQKGSEILKLGISVTCVIDTRS